MKPRCVQKVFTKKQCENIISFHSDWVEMVGTFGTRKLDPNIRQCMTYTPPSIEYIPNWFLNEIFKTISFVNKKFYNFDLSDNFELNLLRYDSGGHYETHIDFINEQSKRKISFTLFLNDSYEGGKLKFIGLPEKTMSSIETGDMILFPSFFPHKVEPVTSGVRWALVGWILGDKHFI